LQTAGYFPFLPAFRRASILALISARETGFDRSICRKILSNLFSAVALTLIATCYQSYSTCVIGMIIRRGN